MSEATQKRFSGLGRVRCIEAVLGLLALASPAWAELPDYTFRLQARTNLLGNASGAYNVDPGNLLAGSLQVPITWDQQVAFRLSLTPEGRSAVWWGKNGQGSRIYLLPNLGEDARTGDPGLNSAGDIAFGVAGATNPVNNGIYLFNALTPNSVRIFHEPLGATDWQSLWLNEAGQLGFRALISGSRVYTLMTPAGAGFQTVLLAKEQALDPSSPYQFLYSPTLNDLGQMAGVGDLATASAEYFQQLHVFQPDGTATLVVQSRGLDPASPIYRFASVQPALNNQGQIAFLGTAKDPTGKNLVTLWLWDGTALRVLAQNGKNGIRDLETFPPDINDSGLVVFRAIDTTGLRAVWVSDGQAVKRVVSEHDIVPSDLGPARVDQELATSPVFAGGPLINARGDVTIVAGLAPPENDQEEWGTAIYVAQATYASGQPDGGVDGGSGELDGGSGGWDAGVDAGPGGPDASVDGGSGEGVDAGVDGGSGDVTDAGVDGGSQETPDAAVDGGPEPVADAGVDGGSGETPDASVDAGSGGPPDSGISADAGPDETPDAGDSKPPPGPVPDSGCGCQTTSNAALWPWLLLGLARYLTVRRRGGADRG